MYFKKKKKNEEKEKKKVTHLYGFNQLLIVV